MGTIGELETTLNKLEDSLVKLKAAQGSIVKLPKAEMEVLTLCAKLHDMMTAAIQDKEDRTREKLIDIYGGDCMRIARSRAILEAIKLSEKNEADPRVPSSLTDCSIIEGILKEKGLGGRLSAAFDECIPWRPPSERKTAAVPAPAPAPTPAHAPAPSPAPTPAPTPAPASGGHKTETYVKTSDGDKHKKPLGTSEEKRTVTVEAEVDVEPNFDFGEADNTFKLEVDTLKVTLRLKVSPPLPEDPSLKKFQPVQEITLKMPKLKNFVFDGNTGTPQGGSVQCVLEETVNILELPGNIDAKASFKTQAPWGSQELFEGDDETVLHHDVKVQGKFSMGDGDNDSTLLDLEMKVTFTASLSGVGSKKFSSTGQPLPAPSHPGA